MSNPSAVWTQLSLPNPPVGSIPFVDTDNATIITDVINLHYDNALKVLHAANFATSGTFTGTFSGPTTGIVDGSNAAAGAVGEYVSGIVARAAAIPLVNGVVAAVASLALPAGDWDVEGYSSFISAAGTSLTAAFGGVNTSSTALGTKNVNYSEFAAGTGTYNGANMNADWNVNSPNVRLNLTATITAVFLVVQGVFTASTLSAYGALRARRIR